MPFRDEDTTGTYRQERRDLARLIGPGGYLRKGRTCRPGELDPALRFFRIQVLAARMLWSDIVRRAHDRIAIEGDAWIDASAAGDES